MTDTSCFPTNTRARREWPKQPASVRLQNWQRRIWRNNKDTKSPLPRAMYLPASLTAALGLSTQNVTLQPNGAICHTDSGEQLIGACDN